MKNILKILFSITLVLISFSASLLGPFYYTELNEKKILSQEEVVSSLDQGPEEDEVIIGELILSYLKIKVEDKYHLQICCSVVSGLFLAFAICYIIKNISKKEKPIKDKEKGKGDKIIEVNSIKVNFPTPQEQNTHKNNIIF